MIFVYWFIAVVLIILMLANKDKLAEYGFSKEKITFQIIVGVIIGIAMSLVLTLMPHLSGFGELCLGMLNRRLIDELVIIEVWEWSIMIKMGL